MFSIKQDLAIKRNWLKLRITGSFIDNNCTTLQEKTIINEINLLRKVLIDSFDENSRNLGLKVPVHRCWFSPCKCKAKYRVGNTDLYLCKKHSDAEQDLIKLYGN